MTEEYAHNSRLGEREARGAQYLLFEITLVPIPLPSVQLARYNIFEVT